MTLYAQNPTLVVACSGCNALGQLSSDIALQLVDEGRASTTCSLGIAVAESDSVKRLWEACHVVTIDGCNKVCALDAVRTCGVEPSLQIELTSLGLKNDHHSLSISKRFSVLKFVYQRLDELKK